MPFHNGDRVRHIKLKKNGTVTAVLSGGRYKINIGSLSLTCEEKELRAGSSNEPAGKITVQADTRANTGKPLVLDLHGARVHEVRELVERAVNTALLQNADALEIVHGHGSGKVLREVHSVLSGLSVVKRFELKQQNSGTTVVYL